MAGSKRPPRRIELSIHEVNQLFNLMDPSPFVDKDLDQESEVFIVNWAREYPIADPVTLTIHLERWPAADPRPMLEEAVHNFFAYRAKLNRLEFRRLMDQGRTSAVIGIGALAVGLFTGRVLLAHVAGPWAGFVRESLTIVGWVAMWRPIQIYLHDWWPVRRTGRIYQKLSVMPVEVVPKAPTGSHSVQPTCQGGS